MCGATDEQYELQDEQMDFYKQLQDLTKQQYGNQQAIYAPMAESLMKIFQKGPNQKGFSDEQRNNLESNVITGTSRNYSDAAVATNNALAARGGGTNPMTGGAEDEMRQKVALSAAQEKSSEESKIISADYDQGYKQWLNSISGLGGIAAGENPAAYIGGANDAGGAASSTAKTIADSENSWINAAIGAAGSIGGMAAGKLIPTRA